MKSFLQLPVDRFPSYALLPHVLLSLTASVKKLAFEFAHLDQDLLLSVSSILMVDVMYQNSPSDAFFISTHLKHDNSC